jgi:superfamily II DNA or RNA helicase
VSGPPAVALVRTSPAGLATQRGARYLAAAPRDFLTVATPGAGKTAFALRVAAELLADRVIDAITVVTPTEHLKTQWSLAAAQAGIAIDPDFRNSTGATSADYRGIAVTYAGVAAHPLLHRARTEARRTLVVLDEVHHAGDARSWGEAVREAFDPATRRLTLTGTPFRSDDNPIPFVDYLPDAEGALRSRADHAYGYAEALADGVVRPVVFLAYSGLSSWRTSAGEEITARLGEPLTAEQTARAWRTALDPGGEWIPAVLAAADRRLTGHREGGMPDAGGLVIASRPDHRPGLRGDPGDVRHAARGRALRRASARIARFAASEERWMVAVRMVSEGVDVPRLAVGVYATSASTPLYFAQAVGRFVRSRRRGRPHRCSCRRCRCCWGWPVSWRRSATTCWAAAPRRGAVGRRAARPGPAHGGRAGGGREGVHRSGGARRARPADLRRHVLLGRRGGLSRPARPARARPGADTAQPAAEGLDDALAAGRARAARPRCRTDICPGAAAVGAGADRSCARSSTRWCRCTTTARRSRTV